MRNLFLSHFSLKQCNAAVGVKSFFDMMHSGPHKLMLFGAACTHVTDPIAKASKHWHLTQVSFTCERIYQQFLYSLLFSRLSSSQMIVVYWRCLLMSFLAIFIYQDSIL